MKLHLCCGKQILEDFINVDQLDFGQEIVADLNKKWKFAKNNSVEYIYIKDGLEHLESLEHFFKECERVLKPKGIVEIRVPHYKSPSAYRMTHKHYFSWNFFNTFPEPHDNIKKLKVISNQLIFEPKVFPFTLMNILTNLFPKYWEKFFYACEIKVKLQKTE
ncbi:MAG: methyltransferase domain-containing protein [Candidatus Diapherotrites archaeon]